MAERPAVWNFATSTRQDNGKKDFLYIIVLVEYFSNVGTLEETEQGFSNINT